MRRLISLISSIYIYIYMTGLAARRPPPSEAGAEGGGERGEAEMAGGFPLLLLEGFWSFSRKSIIGSNRQK